MKLTYKQKQVLSLVSACLVHTVFGAMYTLGAVTPYIASHIYYESDPSIKAVDVSACYPTLMVMEAVGIFLSMYDNSYIGYSYSSK